jgi:hypothetical protein
VTDEWLDHLHVFCADIGSIPKGRFAWARRHPRDPHEEVHAPASIESLAAALVFHLQRSRPVALGFEMPLFLPVPEDSMLLGTARPTDKNAPAWSSSTGASVLATGIVQVAWTLRTLHRQMPSTPVFLQWEPFAAAQTGLFLWEAFVSRSAKGKTHEEDAAIGLKAFCDQLPVPGEPEGKEIDGAFSPAAALAIWAGWSLPHEELRRPGVVVRAKAPVA